MYIDIIKHAALSNTIGPGTSALSDSGLEVFSHLSSFLMINCGFQAPQDICSMYPLTT